MQTICKFCGESYNPERKEAGYDYCMKQECLLQGWERPSGIAIVMVHKQGFNVIQSVDAEGQNFMDVHGRSF